MSVIAGQSRAEGERPTLASTWWAISGGGFTDELLAWPPDVFALSNALLDRSEAFRFALSPPEGVRWPPAGAGDWCDAVVDAGREWSAWVEDRRGSIPSMLADEWGVALERADLRRCPDRFRVRTSSPARWSRSSTTMRPAGRRPYAMKVRTS
jgi:hypothetical protein